VKVNGGVREQRNNNGEHERLRSFEVPAGANASSIVGIGILIARVSGQSLGTFMCERIFDPLGMTDTAFHVPSEKVERLPGFYFFWTLAYGAME
jgi:CubicO group peptidase (beta-lactamase class C family)